MNMLQYWYELIWIEFWKNHKDIVKMKVLIIIQMVLKMVMIIVTTKKMIVRKRFLWTLSCTFSSFPFMAGMQVLDVNKPSFWLHRHIFNMIVMIVMMIMMIMVIRMIMTAIVKMFWENQLLVFGINNLRWMLHRGAFSVLFISGWVGGMGIWYGW